jgi:hypothetical protein
MDITLVCRTEETGLSPVHPAIFHERNFLIRNHTRS